MIELYIFVLRAYRLLRCSAPRDNMSGVILLKQQVFYIKVIDQVGVKTQHAASLH